MWFKANTPNGETTNDILQVLLNSHPGEIIAMDGPAKSGKYRMIELLVMDNETRRIDVVEVDGQDTIYSSTEDIDFGAEPDVYVLTDLDQWEDIRADQPALLLWIESMLSDEKTIIITGEQLYERLPELISGIQAQHGDRFSFYQYWEDDLTHVNMNPYPHIHVGSLIRLGQFQRSITHPNMEPLFWRVIFRRGYMVWLLATDSVGVLNYSNEGVEVDWRHSPLRLWLNRQFLDGFSEEVIDAIMDNRSSGDEQNVDEKEAPSVSGKVILPSAYEVEHFLPDPKDRTLTTVRQRLTEKGRMEISLAPTDWWLRTYGADAGTAAFVRADGSIDRGGKRVWEHCAVRPMVLVNLNRLPEALALAADDELPF